MRGVDGDCAAEGGNGWGAESASSAAMYTKPVKPAAPSTVSLHSDAQGTSLTVDWDRPYYNGANITNYTVYSNASAGGAAMVKAVPADPATGIPPLFQLFPDLDPHTPYTFEVSATNEIGEGPKSAPFTFWTDWYVPDAPAGVTNPPSRTSTTITVEWTVPESNGGELYPILYYEISYRCDFVACPAKGADGVVLDPNVGVGQDPVFHKYTANSLQPNSRYLFRVRAYNAYMPSYSGKDGWGDYSLWEEFTRRRRRRSCRCGRAATATELTATGVKLGWRCCRPPTSVRSSDLPLLADHDRGAHVDRHHHRGVPKHLSGCALLAHPLGPQPRHHLQLLVCRGQLGGPGAVLAARRLHHARRTARRPRRAERHRVHQHDGRGRVVRRRRQRPCHRLLLARALRGWRRRPVPHDEHYRRRHLADALRRRDAGVCRRPRPRHGVHARGGRDERPRLWRLVGGGGVGDGGRS